jgi:hypothetical protein
MIPGLDDPIWSTLADVRGDHGVDDLLRALRHSPTQDAWDRLWESLFHQGDTAVVSYVALAHVVAIYRQYGGMDWNPFAMAASIELSRGIGANPDVPAAYRSAYLDALMNLSELGCSQLHRSPNPLFSRSVLGFIAVHQHLRTYARILIEMTEDEVLAVLAED